MQTVTVETPVRKGRKFLPEDILVDSWERLQPYFEQLEKRSITSLDELKKWLVDKSELESFLSEDLAKRYIKMNIDTTDASLQENFVFFVEQIEPKMAPYLDQFNQKLLDSPFAKELDGQYHIMLREAKKDRDIYREENIPLFTELEKKAQEYGKVSAGMTVTIDGKEITLQQAGKYLKDTDREKREEVFRKIQSRRLKDKDALNTLFTELIGKRHMVAQNAGFENYRDFKLVQMGRFDYSKEDCFVFHDSVAAEVTPLLHELHEERKQALKLDRLRPWDTSVDITGKPPLKPFEGAEELVAKTAKCYNEIHPFFGECLETMEKMGHLDLESKKGKAPGGFNYPLYEVGIPFIFMNAVGTHRDMVTMLHEGGHAIHSFLSKDLELLEFKSFTSEVAELASMSMELISMEHWEVFFEDEADLRRAKREQLESIISILPWVGTVDRFQHLLYEQPEHTLAQRYEKWNEVMGMFSSKVVDWAGLEDARDNVWQKQLHLFEVPFYYIEYGIAQLGAIAVWRNYKTDPKKAVQQYMDALQLGYTKPIGEIYETAGVSFDFSREYIRELMQFLKEELNKLK